MDTPFVDTPFGPAREVLLHKLNFCQTPSHGRPRLQVKDVRAKTFV